MNDEDEIIIRLLFKQFKKLGKYEVIISVSESINKRRNQTTVMDFKPNYGVGEVNIR